MKQGLAASAALASLEKVEEGKPRPQSSIWAPDVRDIAALCANQPEIAKQHLAEVVQARDPLPGEDQTACDRRRANAYYYLGLTESNFSLPRIGNRDCTVFSTLSKRNESSDTIRRHIELIREGQVLL